MQKYGYAHLNTNKLLSWPIYRIAKGEMKSQTAAVTFELLFCKWMKETVSGTDQPNMGYTEWKT